MVIPPPSEPEEAPPSASPGRTREVPLGKLLEGLVREWSRVLGEDLPLLPRQVLASWVSPSKARSSKARYSKNESPPAPAGRSARAGGERGRAPRPSSPGDPLEELHEEIRACRRCGLGRTCRNPIPGEGPGKALFLFVGEGPGPEEDRTGRPLVGPAGDLLTAMIEKGIGIPRSQVYVTNAVKCRPPGDRDPAAEEEAACRDFLARQVRLVAPKVVVALGRVAARALLGSRLPLHVLRGRPKEFQGVPLVLTWNPAYLLRHPEAKREAWEDLKLAMSLAGRTPPAPPGGGQRIR